jgi:hypothetical protein
MTEKFKAGDLVRMTSTCSGNEEGKQYKLVEHNGILYAGFRKENGNERGCSCENYWELVTSSPQHEGSPKFILQYELNTDQFELIYSEKELRKRIIELSQKSELKRESIRVYDVKRMRAVELGVKVTIK